MLVYYRSSLHAGFLILCSSISCFNFVISVNVHSVIFGEKVMGIREWIMAVGEATLALDLEGQTHAKIKLKKIFKNNFKIVEAFRNLKINIRIGSGLSIAEFPDLHGISKP